MSHAQSKQSSSEVSNSYNQSITQTLGANSLGFSVNASRGSGAVNIGDITNFADSFNSQDVYNYVTNSGAGATVSGNPSAAQGGGASMFSELGKWIPWIAVAAAAFVIVKYIRK